MKLLSNPFVIGKYVDKDYFCDREKESEMLVHHIVNGRKASLMILLVLFTTVSCLCNCYLLKKVFMSSSAKSCSLNMAKVFPQHWWSDSINAFKALPGICSSR